MSDKVHTDYFDLTDIFFYENVTSMYLDRYRKSKYRTGFFLLLK